MRPPCSDPGLGLSESGAFPSSWDPQRGDGASWACCEACLRTLTRSLLSRSPRPGSVGPYGNMPSRTGRRCSSGCAGCCWGSGVTAGHGPCLSNTLPGQGCLFLDQLSPSWLCYSMTVTQCSSFSLHPMQVYSCSCSYSSLLAMLRPAWKLPTCLSFIPFVALQQNNALFSVALQGVDLALPFHPSARSLCLHPFFFPSGFRLAVPVQLCGFLLSSYYPDSLFLNLPFKN